MSKSIKVSILILFSIFLFLMIAFFPIKNEVIIFRAVLSESSVSIGNNIVSLPAGDHRSKALFILQDDELFLRFQSVEYSLLLFPFVSDFNWTESQLNSLKSSNEQLDQYWDKELSSGVWWLNFDERN